MSDSGPDYARASRAGSGGDDLTTATARTLLPTPLAGDGRHGGPGQTHGQGGPSLSATAALLPTPTTEPTTGNGHARRLGGEVLLPTPVVNDMGEGKTVDRWDEWTADLKTRHGNGNGHGPSLAIEAQRADGRWGAYADAVARWETATGRPAPSATEPGKHGQPRLSPVFVEWMMGLPAGHVTDVPGVERNAQLKALGNGVVPQQAALAVAAILTELPPAVLARLRS